VGRTISKRKTDRERVLHFQGLARKNTLLGFCTFW